MEFQLSCFMMLWKCFTHYASKFGKLSSGHRTGKGPFSFQSQRKAMTKNAQTTTQLHSSHHASKVMPKILQVRLQQYVNHELPDVQAVIWKGKGEKERDNHLNAEFQRTAGRYKKAFPSEQCKEIEENNRMGKTRDFFKKIRAIKGIFHAKMGTIKDGSGMHLTEA